MGLLGSFFNFVDPILDKIDPMHNKVQTWTTGSSETEGQRPYFETIAPMIVDAFLPGVGSAVGAVDKGSNGNWTGAGISALGAMYGLGSLGSTGSSAAGGAEAMNAGIGSTDELASIGTNSADAAAASGYSGHGFDTFSGSSAMNSGIGSSNELASIGSSSADAASQGGYYTGFEDIHGIDAMNGTSAIPDNPQYSSYDTGSHGYGNFSTVKNEATAGQPGYGWQYKDNGYAVSPDGKIYSMGEQVTGSGGQPMGLLDHAGVYANKAGRFINGKDAQQAMKIGAAGMATDQKLRAQQAMKQQQMMPRPVDAPDWGANSGRQVRSFQELSPYQNFNGGFNPRRMSRSGLLG